MSKMMDWYFRRNLATRYCCTWFNAYIFAVIVDALFLNAIVGAPFLSVPPTLPPSETSSKPLRGRVRVTCCRITELIDGAEGFWEDILYLETPPPFGDLSEAPQTQGQGYFL